MKMFDKIRDLFTEEVEVETPVKKEVIQVEIPAPEVAPKEPKVEEKKEPVTRQQRFESQAKPEEKANYPVFFDEKDFDDIQKKEEKVEVKKEIKKEVYKDNYKDVYKDSRKETYREPYGIKKEVKEEKKHFAPTPIISPVYGVLDKNYSKEDIVDKPKVPVSHLDPNITIDDVRNKAYGTLEDELENTLFGKTSIMFAGKDDEEKEDKYSNIEDELKNAADALDLLANDQDDEHKIDNNEDTNDVEITTRVSKNASLAVDEEDTKDKESEEKEDTNLVEDALNSDFSKEEDLSDSDLFNLIDNMYEKGDK